MWFYCEIFDYKSERKSTLKKSDNTKHQEGHYKCRKCSKTFQSKDILEDHMNNMHIEDLDRQGNKELKTAPQQDGMECSMCDDKLLTQKEHTNHISEHLKEIQEIDIEYLKHRHKWYDWS